MALLPFQRPVGSAYGAPMGRHSDPIADLTGRVRVMRVPLVDGDYDPGGAYWGGGRGTLLLFCAWDGEGHVHYLRASDRVRALCALSEKNPAICFYADHR